MINDVYHSYVLVGADEKTQGKGRSEVRLQWDPDHHPDGSPQRRKAIQLGLRDEVRIKVYLLEF